MSALRAKRARFVVAALITSLLATSCRGAFDWRSHLSLRAGKDLQLSHIDPAAELEAGVSANLHYVSIALEAAFFKNLPAVERGGDVALGVEIEGLLPGSGVVRTVVGTEKASGRDGALVFENAFSTAPVVYTGRRIGISLHLRAIDGDSAPGVRGRVSGAGKVARLVDPSLPHALRLGGDLFQSIVVGRAARAPAWSYSIELHPADSTHRDKPETLFTATRHVMLLLPPPGAPSSLRRPRAGELVGKLRLSGTRLVWSDSGLDFSDSPYVVLNVTRYRRYPSPETPLRRADARLQRLAAEGLHPQALSAARDVAREIAADRVISAVERNLEKSRLEVTRARIRAHVARDAKDHAAELGAILRQLERVAGIRADFVEVLEPYERVELEHQLSRLARRAREIAPQAGKSAADLAEALRPYTKKIDEARARDDLERRALASVRGQLGKLQTDMTRRQEELAKKLTERSEFVPKLHKQGWFWALVGAALVGTGTALYLSLRPGAQLAEPGATVPLR